MFVGATIEFACISTMFWSSDNDGVGVDADTTMEEGDTPVLVAAIMEGSAWRRSHPMSLAA